MTINGTVIVKAGDRTRRLNAARARVEKRNSPEAREANRLRHELIHRNDHLAAMNEAIARRDRAQTEVDRLALRLHQYETLELETGRVSDALAHTSVMLDAARRMLATAETAVTSEKAKLAPESEAEKVPTTKGVAR